MKTITIEATHDGSTRRSTAPEGYALHSVTIEMVGDYAKIWHHYVPIASPTSSPSEAEIERRVDLNWELDPRFSDGTWKQQKWTPEDLAAIKDIFRRQAIKELLAERGAK